MNLSVELLSFHYTPDRPVLSDVSFTLGSGQFLSLLGPNGVGKSTLFRCILRLLSSYQGKILIDGRDIRGLSTAEMAKCIAYIPQSHHPTFNYTVFDMVLMGTTAQRGSFSSPGKEQEARAAQALEKMGISDFAGRYYAHLSGGERQLVLIARALAQQSHLLLMDEPTANLDYGNQIRVLQRIRQLAQEGYCILQSTHNPDQAYLFSHEILAMKDGQIIAHGAPADVLNKQLIQALYGIDVEVEHLCQDKFRVCVPTQLLL